MIGFGETARTIAMTEARPDVDLLVQQYLSENGYGATLAAMKEETGKCYDPFSSGLMGSQLVSIIDEHYDLKAAMDYDDKNGESSRLEESLLRLGQATYAYDMEKSYSPHSHNIISISFCKTGDPLVVTGSTDRTVKVSNINDGSIVAECDTLSAPVLCVRFHPNLPFVAASLMDGSHFVLNIADKSMVQAKDHTKYVTSLEWSHDGTLLATASSDHCATVYRVVLTQQEFSMTLLHKIPFPNVVESVCFHEKSNQLVIAVRLDNYLHHCNLDDFTITKVNMNSNLDDHVSFTAMHLAPSPDGKFLLVVTDKSRLILYPFGESTQLRSFYGTASDQYAQPKAIWHPSGKLVLAIGVRGGENSIVGYDVASQQPLFALAGHTATVRDIDIDSASGAVTTCSYDRTVKFWRCREES